MKIVHVETGRHFYGGPQQVIWLVQGLVSAGIDCHLVCPPDAEIAAVAIDAGICMTTVPCSGDYDLRFAWRLRKFLCRARPDVVHCHSRRGADFLGGWAARAADIPAVLSRRVDDPESSLLARFRYQPFRSIVAISEHIATILTGNGLSPARLTVIRDAVDVESINPYPAVGVLKSEFGIEDQAVSIAVVAQLIPRKGHRFLLDVLPGLCETHAPVRVVFFGVGHGEGKLRALTAKLRLDATVRFEGFRRDLDEYLAAFDILVHPAEKEGLGVAMLKGAAAGLPVVAFDVAGAKEAVVHGKTGVLVPPGDQNALQGAIELMIDEPTMRRQLGLAGRKRMQDEFSVKSMVESHIDLYKHIRK
jgi:glycosyltransferase involved in cell wall biosynthesis